MLGKNLFKKLSITTLFTFFLFTFNCSSIDLLKYPNNSWEYIKNFLEPETNTFLKPTPNMIPSKWKTIYQNKKLTKQLKKAGTTLINTFNTVDKTSPKETIGIFETIKNKILCRPLLTEKDKIQRLKNLKKAQYNIEKSIQNVTTTNLYIKSQQPSKWWKFWWGKGIHNKISTNGVTKTEQLKYLHKLTKQANFAYLKSCKDSLGEEIKLNNNSRHLKNALAKLAIHQAQFGNVSIFKENIKFIVREMSFLLYPETPILRLAFITGTIYYIYKVIENYLKNKNKKTLWETIKKIFWIPITTGFALQNFNILTQKGFILANKAGELIDII